MKYSTQQLIEVRAKLQLFSSMLSRVSDDLGDLSIGRDFGEHVSLFSKLSDATCEWSHAIDSFRIKTENLTKE
jgi:hypothetical protein